MGLTSSGILSGGRKQGREGGIVTRSGLWRSKCKAHIEDQKVSATFRLADSGKIANTYQAGAIFRHYV